jgi:four helix bundle protein
MFDAFEVALKVIEQLGAILDRIAARDPALAVQIRKAAGSIASNLAEGSARVGKDRMHHYRVSRGSALEVVAHLRVALAWRYVTDDQLIPVMTSLDRLLAMCWKLTGPHTPSAHP